MAEVRFDRMVPAQVVARRNGCSLAYLPVGSLEWHGPHMPFGTDYFTVTLVAEEAARRFGGVVFPPVYYGDVRYILQECREEWRQSYVKEMQVPEGYVAAFPLMRGSKLPTQPDDGLAAQEPLEFTEEGQEREFVRLIARTMLEIHLYGFRHILLLPGHGPNPGFCRRAEEVYAQNVGRRSAFGEPAKTRTWWFLEVAKEFEPILRNFWTHACKWEGSLVMVAQPGTVHLDQLPEDRKKLVPAYLGEPYLDETDGYNPEYRHLWDGIDALDPRSGTSEAYGREQLEGLLLRLGEEIEGFLKP